MSGKVGKEEGKKKGIIEAERERGMEIKDTRIKEEGSGQGRKD